MYSNNEFVRGMYAIAKDRGIDTEWGVPHDIFIDYWEHYHNMKLWEHGIKMVKTSIQIKKGYILPQDIYIIWNELENQYPFMKGDK